VTELGACENAAEQNTMHAAAAIPAILRLRTGRELDEKDKDMETPSPSGPQ
jgi:hypothetical protein